MASEANRGRLTEERIFSQLHAALPADEYVIHTNLDWTAFKGERTTRAEGEIDVVVCHRTKGVLVFEIKGGGLEYDVCKDDWTSIDASRKRHTIKDPMKQARDGTRHLLTMAERDPVLSHGGRFPLPIGFGAILPDTGWKKELPLNWQPELAIDRSDLNELRKAIDGAFDYWLERFPPRKELHQAQWQHLNARLSPKGTRVVSLASIIARDEETLVDLTMQQMRALAMLRAFPRLRVQGCAGSGKTMLAVEEAKRLAGEGKRVLLLCFNRLLAGYLRQATENADEVVASGFHELCWSICEEVGVEPQKPGADLDTTTYWREQLPLTAFEQLDRYEPRFDAVIVDEGQDFLPDWWAMIESLLTPDGRLVFFYDPNQDIFETGAAIPIDSPPAQLTINCRSTAAINRAARAVGEVTFPCEDGPVPGELPEFRESGSAREVQKSLSSKLTELVDSQGLKSNSILVLSPRRLEKSSLDGKDKIGYFRLVEEQPSNSAEIRFATLQSFKGLEADVILMFDVDLDHKTWVPANMNVAFSRAKHRLAVWLTPGQVERLQDGAAAGNCGVGGTV